jgi:polysaccharide export outer membrane protein
MRFTLRMYLFAATLSIACGAGVGFAAEDPADAGTAAGMPAALASLDAEAIINAPETEPVETLPALYVSSVAPGTSALNEGYRLGTGDKIRVTVYGEPDLSGEFQVDGSGFVRLPLVGQVSASGHTIREFEGDVAARLSEGYLRSPRVSAEVVNYRPFFILGEVNKPGEYPYVNGMNVVTAVALAGGFTYRADEGDVYIRRGGKPEEEYPADETTAVLPGDIIRVTERFF